MGHLFVLTIGRHQIRAEFNLQILAQTQDRAIPFIARLRVS